MIKRLINLDRCPDRLAQFKHRNSHLDDISRFSAIDGSKLLRSDLIQQGLLQGDPPFSAGSIGNFLSHTTLWNDVVKSGEAITILEDDAIVAHNFTDESERMVASLGPNWDIVFWGCNFDSFVWLDFIPGVSPAVLRLYQDRMRKNIGAFQDQALSRNLFRLRHLFGTVCYSISPSGAQSLLDYCLPIRKLSISFPEFNIGFECKGLDSVINGILPKLNAFISLPPLVLTENRHEGSTVQQVAEKSR